MSLLETDLFSQQTFWHVIARRGQVKLITLKTSALHLGEIVLGPGVAHASSLS